MHAPKAPRRTARRLGPALAAAALVLTAVACNATTPGHDAFYTPPSPLGTGANGDVVRSRSATFTLDPTGHVAAPGIRSTQVLYRSTDALGQPIAVSGTVLVPTTPWIGLTPRPLVSYAVGTRGLGDHCAPSYTMSQGTDYEGAFINTLLLKGWAVAVTDYQGLGTPGTHTYMVGPAQGHAVLDMARAAERLSGSGLSASSPVGIMGYSQGGGAAGWAAELAGTYAPELKIKGVAEGGVPADLPAVADFVDGGPAVALALMAAIGMDSAYPELQLESYLNAKGQALIDGADDTCLVTLDGFNTILDTALHSRRDYVTTDPLTVPAWKARLAQSKLGRTIPKMPIFQYHALLDELVPYGQADALRAAYCKGGAKLTFDTIPLAEHVTGMVKGFPVAVEYLDARFAGIPVPSTCI